MLLEYHFADDAMMVSETVPATAYTSVTASCHRYAEFPQVVKGFVADP